MKRMLLCGAALAWGACVAGNFDVTKLQAEIDAAAARGGGTVVVPPGRWETGPLALKSHVTLKIEKGAILLGDRDVQVYRKAGLSALIHTEKAEDVAITGEGVIDGRGSFMPSAAARPHLINFRDCRNVRVEGVTLRCGGSWTINPLRCDGVVIRNVKIWAHVNHCEDGIDISSKNVLVEHCEIDADDDALVFKTPSADVEVEHVEVRDCLIRSSCNAIKFGTESHGLMRHIRVHDCVLAPTSAHGRFDWRNANQGISAYLTGLAGIAVECVDGETLEDVTVSNIRMTGYQTPIFVRLGRRHPPKAGRLACLRDVVIENVTATAESRIACSITGVPGLKPRGVTLRNVHLTLPGGGTFADTWVPVPEVERNYPDAHMFAGLILPAHGLYVRHAEAVKLENVTFTCLSPDARPAVVVDDADVSTTLSDVRRMTAEERRVGAQRYVASLRTADGFLYVPPTVSGVKPPLYVGLAADPDKIDTSALDECRRRAWAMLQPFARDVPGLTQAIARVRAKVNPARIFISGSRAQATLALNAVAAAPALFAGVSAVMPLEEVKGLEGARGVPVNLVTAGRNRCVSAALAAFGAMTGEDVPGDVATSLITKGCVPAAARYPTEHPDFPKAVRPLAYRLERSYARLSVTDTSGVSIFLPQFNWLAGLPPRAVNGKRRLIFAGDSTLQHRADASKAGSWGEALREALKDDFEIVNCAIGGRSTKTYMPEWLTNTVAKVRLGDWVIIQFGHNDMSKASDPKVDRQTDPDTAYMNNLLRFVADVRYRGGVPLLVTPISLYLYNRDAKAWPAKDPLDPWVQAMVRLAREHQVPLVDLHALTVRAVREAGAAASRPWYMFSVDGKDWAHPTKAGAAAFARLFAEDVRHTAHPAAALLR